MCCPAGEHVNMGGGLPTSSFSHHPKAPPVTHGGREEWGGGWRLQSDGKGIGWYKKKGRGRKWVARKKKINSDVEKTNS